MDANLPFCHTIWSEHIKNWLVQEIHELYHSPSRYKINNENTTMSTLYMYQQSLHFPVLCSVVPDRALPWARVICPHSRRTACTCTCILWQFFWSVRFLWLVRKILCLLAVVGWHGRHLNIRWGSFWHTSQLCWTQLEPIHGNTNGTSPWVIHWLQFSTIIV